MPGNSKNLLCGYSYDPLNRLAAITPPTQASARLFYRGEWLSTELQVTRQHSIMQHGDWLLAQREHENGVARQRLLATDLQSSVLSTVDIAQAFRIAYTPYGHRSPQNALHALPGFTGKRPDPVTSCYLLGNGYRAFNPVLMRFHSPDSWSPFQAGGLNAYAYCRGDPVNQQDPSGHLTGWNPRQIQRRIFGRRATRRDAMSISSSSSRDNDALSISSEPTGIETPAQNNQPSQGSRPLLFSELALLAHDGDRTANWLTQHANFGRSTADSSPLNPAHSSSLASFVAQHQVLLEQYTVERQGVRNLISRDYPAPAAPERINRLAYLTRRIDIISDMIRRTDAPH